MSQFRNNLVKWSGENLVTSVSSTITLSPTGVHNFVRKLGTLDFKAGGHVVAFSLELEFINCTFGSNTLVQIQADNTNEWGWPLVPLKLHPTKNGKYEYFSVGNLVTATKGSSINLRIDYITGTCIVRNVRCIIIS